LKRQVYEKQQAGRGGGSSASEYLHNLSYNDSEVNVALDQCVPQTYVYLRSTNVQRFNWQ
jgi:hypothetical protein